MDTEAFAVGRNNAAYSGSGEALCQICGDRATGRHYGVLSCDGCKGFFRRSIRKQQNYQCRQQKRCSVEKDKRNQCRYCRLQKCIRIGMKQDAVQSERDRISARSAPPASNPPPPIPAPLPPPAATPAPPPQQSNTDRGGMLSVILNAELVFHQQAAPSPINEDIQEAGVDELLNSMKEQVLLLVQWAKRFPPFMQLAVDDQICLLKAHASEHLLLGVTRRSRNQSYLLLGNNYIVSRQSPENSFALIAGRVLDQLIIAFRNMNVDDTEYACLKAIVFFDPYAEGLQARDCVFAMRQEIIMALYTYIRSTTNVLAGIGLLNNSSTFDCSSLSNSQLCQSSPRSSTPTTGFMGTKEMERDVLLIKRFGELLLLVPSVRSIAEDMVDHIKFYKLFGAAKVDNVLHELLLGDTVTDDNVQPAPPTSSCPNSQPGSYPSSGAATPALCNVPSIGANANMDTYEAAEGNFEAPLHTQTAPATSFNVNPYGIIDAEVPVTVPLNVMTPQHNTSGSPSLTSPMTQSPGLSTLAAAAFVASQSMASQPSSSAFSSSGVFLSPPSEQYSVTDRIESPTILSFALSARNPIPNGQLRRSTQTSPPSRSGGPPAHSSIPMKREQTE